MHKYRTCVYTHIITYIVIIYIVIYILSHCILLVWNIWCNGVLCAYIISYHIIYIYIPPGYVYNCLGPCLRQGADRNIPGTPADLVFNAKPGGWYFSGPHVLGKSW